jgi:oxazoline/thiazoline synthase
LLSEQTQTVLQGRLYELVAPCLDGRTTEEVCAHLRGQASAAQVFYTLYQLEQKGYLTDGDAPLLVPEAALWALQQVDPADAARRLAETPVAVRSAGAVDANLFRDLLQALHVHLDGEPALTVVVTNSYLRNELRACNEEALRDGRPWMLVKPTGAQVWIGPLFLPSKTGCWECLAERLRANSPVAGYLEEVLGHTGAAVADRCYTQASLQVGYGLAATAIASWVVAEVTPWKARSSRSTC